MGPTLKLNVLIVVYSILVAIDGNCQGRVDGFYKGKGMIEVGLGGGIEFDNAFFAGTNKINLSREIRSASLFIGTGLTEKLDLYINIPYVSIGNAQSVQDGSVFLKYQILKKDVANGKLSFSLASGFSGNLSNYQTSGVDAIGQQARVIDIRPLVHYELNGWFATLQYAYNYKFDPVPSAVTGSLKLGYAASKFYLDVWYENQITKGGFDYLGTPTPPSFRELGVNFNRIGATYYRPFGKRIGAYTGTYYTLNGRNIGQGPYISLGFILKSM